MPLQAIDQMFFVKQSGVLAKDVISVLCVDDRGCTDIQLLESQRLIADDSTGRVTGCLPELLYNLEKEDADFPSKFVEYATGCPYLPHLPSNPSFRIMIEFNSEDKDTRHPNSYPFSHSCDATVKIPATAYGGKMETLREKLTYAVKHSACRFDSA